MNEYKTIGCKLACKLIYYAIALVVLIAIVTFGLALMTKASTILFLAGLICLAIAVGAGVAFLIKEIRYYFRVTEKLTNED